MTARVTASWGVDAAGQAGFVALSGDANPIHTDPLVARRSPFGRVAVHGMHLALDTLERFAATAPVVPSRVRATFRQPVGVDDPITTDIVTDDKGATARLTVDGHLVADLRVEAWTDARTDPRGSAGPTADLELTPEITAAAADLDLDAIAGRAGALSLWGDAEAIARRFPRSWALGASTVTQLLAITRLVGMEVPGLRSLLSSLDLTIEPADPSAEPALRYRVQTVDDRFSRVVIRVDGPTVHGTVTAFVRPVPTDQLVDTSIVTPDEFSGVRALVVGGSRGLGAAAVQLLADGGADVRFTYHRGADDAARVAGASGASASRFAAEQLDGTSGTIETDDTGLPGGLAAITRDGWQPTLLAWFASPPIFVGARDVYSPTSFERFRAIYVDAFVAAVDRLGPERLLGLLWPSSTAVEIDVPGLAEYADAKRLGERVCADLASAHPHLRIDVTRFPRLRTDQTASFVPVDSDDPAPHVLAALRRCAGRHQG